MNCNFYETSSAVQKGLFIFRRIVETKLYDAGIYLDIYHECDSLYLYLISDLRSDQIICISQELYEI